MKYQGIHDDFQRFRYVHLPIDPKVLPLTNSYLKMRVSSMTPMANTQVEKQKILGYQNGAVELTIFTPEGIGENSPCLIYMHGGAFMIGAVPYQLRLANIYALRGMCKVVFVEYRLAPKYPFPTAVKDCYAVLEWVMENAGHLGIDINRIAVGGDSAGGNLAAALALMARDRQQCSLCYQMLIYPVLDAKMRTESMKRFVDTPMWNARQNKKMWEVYLRDFWQSKMPKEYASPLEAPSFQNLPNGYIEVAEYDCLRDEGLLYGELLQKAGSEITIHQSWRTIHGFELNEHSKIVQDCVEKRVVALHRAFYGEKGEKNDGER